MAEEDDRAQRTSSSKRNEYVTVSWVPEFSAQPAGETCVSRKALQNTRVNAMPISATSTVPGQNRRVKCPQP